jgi:hypothetical protein
MAKLCSSNLIAGCTEPDWPAPAFTDSGRRRFSTQISTQNGSKAAPECYMPWSWLQTGVFGQDALPAFQAGHAGSIPVARSSSLSFFDFVFPYVRDSRLPPGRKGAPAIFFSSIAILEHSHVDVRGRWDYPA